jgi:hypothetical protein
MELIISMDFYGVGLPYIEGGITYDHWRMKGVVTYMAGVYLAALKAMQHSALLLSDATTAHKMEELFSRGQKSFEQMLWHKDRYALFYHRQQKGYSPSAQRAEEGHLDPQTPPAECMQPGGSYTEVVDLKGIMTDLLNGDATAQAVGLGSILSPTRVKKQLRLILKNNLDRDNKALVNGTYPDGSFPDEFPFAQWHTPWTGAEYAFAMQLYTQGMINYGDAIVQQVFERQSREGMRFNHCEANDHYTRPMVIWGAWNARMGVHYNGIEQLLQITPPLKHIKAAVVTAPALGTMHYTRSGEKTLLELKISDGRLKIGTLHITGSAAQKKLQVTVDNKKQYALLEYSKDRARIRLKTPRTLTVGSRVRVVLSRADSKALPLKRDK